MVCFRLVLQYLTNSSTLIGVSLILPKDSERMSYEQQKNMQLCTYVDGFK